MKIAFLHQPNDPYTLVRIKYFLSIEQEVLSIVFYNKLKQKEVPGLKTIELPYNPLIRIPFVKRFMYAKEIKRITQKYNIDVFYVISALNSLYLKSSKAKKNFLEIQGSDVLKTPDKFPILKKFYRYYWKFADGMTQDSEIAKNKATAYMPKNILNETIEIGVNFNIFNEKVEQGIVREKYSLKQRPIIFHSRGERPVYNVEIIIESIPLVKKYFKDVCYIFTGNLSSLSKNTVKFIEDNNLKDNIIFTGFIDHSSEMKYYYADADCTLSIPSSDSSPFSVYEAMAMKTPVIVSDLPWFIGKFTPGKHFLTIPDRNTQLLSEATIKMLKNEIQLDLEDAYKIVFNSINMEKENKRLFQLFNKSLADQES